MQVSVQFLSDLVQALAALVIASTVMVGASNCFGS